MKKTLLATVLILSASVASATCNRGHDPAMNCGEGQSYDAETGSCVPAASS